MSDTALIALSMGAVLAATVFTEIGTVKMLAAGVGGGVVTAAKNTIKASARLLVNTSPEPVTNWTAAITEDVTVVGGF